MANLYFADAASNPFANSGPDTLGTPHMLPPCLRNRSVTGVFTSVSTLARSQGIDQGAQYTLLFSPTNDAYVLDVEERVTTFGTYTWSLATNYRSSAGGGINTSQSVLTLSPLWRAVGVMSHPMVDDDVAGLVVATDHNVASFSSPLGIATFNITPLSP